METRIKHYKKNKVLQIQHSGYIALISSFFLQIMKECSRQISNLLKMDLARATLVLIWVLRTLINSIAKNLLKLPICLRFYSFYKKLDIRAI